jgi:hypothetical protein
MSNGKRQEGIRIEERAIRATAALYRVTDFFSDNEPMKWKCRDNAVELVECIEKYYTDNSKRVELLENAFQLSEALRSKLAIVQAGGFISRINFQTLEQEYALISDTLSNSMSDISIGQKNILDINIDRSFFQKDITNERGMSQQRRDTRNEEKHQHMVSTDSHAEQRKKTNEEPSSINERQESIKQALQNNDWMSLSDIASIYNTGVSMKTVQRDTNALVEMGIIRSKGERRWRKYTLVTDDNSLEATK